jgi:hypothetical protein
VTFVIGVSGQRIGPIFKGQDAVLGIVTLKYGTDKLPRNGDKPAYVVQQPGRTKISTTSWEKPDTLHLCGSSVCPFSVAFLG